MINSRMWLVVNPTVGIPLFLGAVAVGSFSTHVAITTNTTWVNDFLSGRDMGATDAGKYAALDDGKLMVERTASGDLASATIVLDDGRTGTIAFENAAPIQTASLD
ncbi:MAG: light-harvesting protein [Pseudomonadota bacterium]